MRQRRVSVVCLPKPANRNRPIGYLYKPPVYNGKPLSYVHKESTQFRSVWKWNAKGKVPQHKNVLNNKD